MTNIRKIRPSESIFNIRLGRDECHLIRSGKCSLDKKPFKRAPRSESDLGYCQKLYNSLINDGQFQPIIVGKASCGHFDFADGQHRVCIAQRKDLILDADIEEYENLCNRCDPKGNSAEEPEYISIDTLQIEIDTEDTPSIIKF